MAGPPPLLFDRALRRRRLDRAAAIAAEGADFLRARAAEDAVWRLSAILRRFPLAVDLNAHGGEFARALKVGGATAQVDQLVEAGLSAPMLAAGERRSPLQVVADEECSPFVAERFDLAVSLLSLHGCNDLVGALVQVRRLLKPDGLFIGALFGRATLSELRQCLLEAESERSGGAGPRVFPFADAADGASLLQRAGFALPVSDVDRVVVRYDHPLALMADLRAMGEGNVLLDRPRRPLTRTVLSRLCELYAERFGGVDGRIPATFEIVTLTGWAPHPSQQQPLKPGSARTRLADALGVREHSPGRR